MDLLQYLKISLLNFSFVMIYIIHKILLLFKNHWNYLKVDIFQYFFNRLLFFLNNFVHNIWQWKVYALKKKA